MFVSAEDFEEWCEEDALIEFEREVAPDIDRELWCEFCLGGAASTPGPCT